MRPPRAPNRNGYGVLGLSNPLSWLILLTVLAIGHGEAPATRDDGPALLVKPDSSIVPADTRVSFFCRADGNPIPTVVWRRNGEPISDSRFTTKTLTNGLSTLRIDPVELGDNNLTISCTADNGVGSPIKAEATLTVLGYEQLPSGFPEIEAHPVLKSVEQGRTAYVTCRVKGNPRPRVLWLRDLMPIDIRSNNRYSVSTLGNPGALMIQQAREDDQGKYECVARNEHGVIHSKPAHIYVKVRRVPPYFTVKLQNVYRVGIGASINLTCVAVGYPMPRVFWKRKSDDYFLNDPETAPFGKNVLTLSNVDRTDNYTCIAVSKLGNIEVSTTVEAKPLLPAPTGVKIVDAKDCNVRIRWDAVKEVTSEDPLLSYIVKYRQKMSTLSSSPLNVNSPEYTERGGVFKEHKVPPSQTSAIIEGLEPYTQYEFIVVGVSALGRGQPALPVESQTAESLPISPPAEVKARPLNSQAVLVQWSPPNNPNGRVIGYEVYFTNKPLSDEADKTGWQKKDFKSDELMATLSGLDPEKTYYIQIRARNAKGVGPFSKTVTVITKQGVPGQPSKLTAKAVDARRISLAWEKPLHSFNIVGYTIRFNVSRTETKELLLTSNVQKHTVDGLRPSTTYSFRVAAHSDRGQGVFGDEVSASTMPIDAFVFPPFTVSRSNLSTVLTVKFGEIQSNTSLSIEYRLGKVPDNTISDTSSYEEDDLSEIDEIEGSGAPENPDKHEFWTRVPIDDADQSKLDVYGLRANTLYEVRLSAGNSTSESVLFKTPEDVPSAPRDLEVNQVNASTVKLTWDRPESENGELLGYYVFKEKLLNGEPVDDHIHHEFVIADPAKLYAFVTGLEPNTEYAFRVCAFNPHGDGERTPAKKMMTGGMPPTPPRPQSVTMLSDDAPLRARIDWQTPENTYGQPINNYAVYYRPVDKLGAQDGFERLEVPGTQHFAELTKLFMGREYEIHISAGTEDGWSANATERLITPVGVPDGEPLNVRYDIVAGQMTLQWDPPAPDRRNGNITYYRAILTPLDGASKRIDRNITGARSSTYRVSAKHGYTFKVAAATMKGEGPFSPVLNVSPYDSALVGSPSNVRVQATSNSSAVIQWDFDDSNGGSDGFIVKYLHEPVKGENGHHDTTLWRSQTVMDPKARYLEIVRLSAHKPYAFCVLAVKQSRLGQCSDPPITVNKLQPIHMVQNLHVQYKTSQSVALKWDYNGPQPIRFFVKQSGQKTYLNQDLVEKRLVAPGFENKVDGAERSFMWQNLRQYMDYTFQVGVVSLNDGTVFWPKEVKVRTDATGPPFVDKPLFLEARNLGTAQIQLKCASEEYGPISHYWIIVVPGNYSKDDVRIMDSAALERSTAALKPRLTIAPVAKKVKKAAADEDDSDDSEEFDAEKVKRALEDEVLEANDYIEQEVEVGRSDEDSGIEADSVESVVKPVKTKSRKSKRRAKRYVEKRSGNSLDGIYIAAQIEAQEMRNYVRDQRSFTLGDSNNYHGFLNHPLDPENTYGVMMRAFAKGESATRRPLEFRAPMQEPAAKLYTDSPLSDPFSTKATDGVGKGKSTSMWLLGPLVIVLVVVIIIGMLLCWRFRSNKKGTRNNRHGSIMKVALPSGGPFMNGVSESSKLLTDAYGRPINGYGDANGNASHMMESSMVDMYPGIGNGQTIMGNQSNYPTVQLPLPINGSLPTQTNAIARGPIPISELATHIDKLKMNNNLLFTQEFECIDGGQHFTWESSSLELNKPKNRYANVVAYDHSRVLLHPIDNVPGSDYINANYIDGYGRAQAYIATQGPLPETFGDFWRMVWEQRSSVIVMLTRLEERARIKCDQYWPSKGTTTYGRITVKLMDTVELAHYTIRTLQLEHRDENELREVKQLQYTAWPDHGVPDHPTPFLMFLKRVKALNAKESGPIISHCSAGIGRTGAFIAIDYMLDKLRRENVVDIFECVTTLRAQRSYMVQTDDQYIFIHDAVLDAAQSGSTEVPADKLYHHTQRLLQPPKPTDELQYNGLELEFMTLSTLKTLNSRCVTANLPVNRPKNRYPHVVPYDTTRVILNPYGSVEGSDYINASWVDGYRQRANYIATQGPMNGTVNDFWRMLWEKESCIIVMLTRLREMGREKCFEYWPVDQPVSFDDTLYVEPIAEYNMPQYVLREFKVTDRQTGQTRTIRHFQFIEWPENGVPKSAEMFIDFIGQVHRTKIQFGNSGPITVHCSTGAGRTGVFIALATIMDRMTLEHVVDVFTTVKLLRTERQNMVEEKDEYQFVYTAALEYLATYAQPYE